MTYRFMNAEDIVAEFRKAGYIEASLKYAAPFYFTTMLPSRANLNTDPGDIKTWALEKRIENRNMPPIALVAMIGETSFGYVHCDFFTTRIDGLKIPSSEQQNVRSEEVHWIGTKTDYYISRDGLQFMGAERIERKFKTDEGVRKMLDEDFHAQRSNLHLLYNPKRS